MARGESTNPLRSLVEMSAERLLIAEKVAYAKWDHGVPVEDTSREASVLLAAVEAARQRGLDAKQVERFFRAQIEANKIVQYTLIAEWQRKGAAPRHAPVQIADIRIDLDKIESGFIDALSKSVAERSAESCNRDVARLVGEHLRSQKMKEESLQAVALDRATSAVCAR